jgi:hypothetical protein
LHLHKFFPDRAREMSRERFAWQPGTIGIGPVEPGELNAPGSHDAFSLPFPIVLVRVIDP